MPGFETRFLLPERQMIHAIWQTIQQVFKDLFAAGGLLASAIGAVSDLLGKTFILPSLRVVGARSNIVSCYSIAATVGFAKRER